jgi:arabinogalactan oligomer/maltooligosaccharide transport system substrate-binding protein
LQGGKKKMKKIAFIALMVLVAGFAFAAGDPEPDIGPVELSVQVEEGWVPYYEAVAERVTAMYPELTINWVVSGAFDHLDIIDQTDAGNPDAADVFAYPLDRLFPLVQNQVLAAIDGPSMAAQVGGFGDYDAGLGGDLMVDGEYFGFPMNIETLIIFVNTANLGETASGTYEFTELDPETMLIPAFNAWFAVAMLNSAEIELLGKTADGELFSDLTTDFADLPSDKQGVFRALFDYWKAHNEAETPLWDSSAAWGYMDSSFTSGGPTGMRLEGPWSQSSLTTQANDGMDLQVIPISQVTINGNPLAHWKGGWAVGANVRIEEDEAKMEVAQAFIREISNPEYAVSFFDDGPGKIMANVEPEVFFESDELSDITKDVVSSVIESYEDAVARPLFIEWGQVWGTWENAMLSWAAVQPDSVEEAYAELQAAFEAMMLNF